MEFPRGKLPAGKLARCRCPQCRKHFVGPVPPGAKLCLPLARNWREDPLYVATSPCLEVLAALEQAANERQGA